MIAAYSRKKTTIQLYSVRSALLTRPTECVAGGLCPVLSPLGVAGRAPAPCSVCVRQRGRGLGALEVGPVLLGRQVSGSLSI